MTLDTYIVQIFIQPGLWLVLCIVCRQVSSCEKLFVALVMVMVSLAGVASTWSVINGLASQEILSLPCYLNITQKIWWSLRNNSTYQSFCMTIHVRDAVMLWCCDAVMLWCCGSGFCASEVRMSVISVILRMFGRMDFTIKNFAGFCLQPRYALTAQTARWIRW